MLCARERYNIGPLINLIQKTSNRSFKLMAPFWQNWLYSDTLESFLELMDCLRP